MNIEEALQFLQQKQGVKFMDCGSDIYITSDRYICQLKSCYVHQLTGDEVIANAERHASVLWRRENFRLLCKDPWLLQCKVCGNVF